MDNKPKKIPDIRVYTTPHGATHNSLQLKVLVNDVYKTSRNYFVALKKQQEDGVLTYDQCMNALQFSIEAILMWIPFKEIESHFSENDYCIKFHKHANHHEFYKCWMRVTAPLILQSRMRNGI